MAGALPAVSSGSLLAHGVGSRQDLPIPFAMVVVGAALAIVASFVVLALAWRHPRYAADRGGRALPTWVTTTVDSPFTQWLLRVVGLVALGFTLLAAVVAPDEFSNPTAGLVFVAFWLGLVPLSLLLGPVWRLLNPVRTLHLLGCRLLRRDPEVGLVRLPAAVGCWPAALGLLGFGWLELVAPERASTPVLRVFLLGYLAAQLVLTAVFGARWLDRGDAFELFSTVMGHLSPFGRDDVGRVVVRSPLAQLARLRPAPGLAAAVCVLLGTTAYDSISSSADWIRFWQGSAVGPVGGGTIGLLGSVLVITGAYLLATGLAGRPTRSRGATGARSADAPAGRFAHSLVPIVLGYFVAHYLTLFVIEGQRVVVAMSDPFSRGDDWFGTAGRVVNLWIGQQPTLVSSLQVAAIVVGHVAGAVAAHDRALEDEDEVAGRGRAARSQLPLLVLMVAYTVAGLLLLFAA